MNRDAVILRRIRRVNVNAGAREAKAGAGLAVRSPVMAGADPGQNSSVVRYSKAGSRLLHGTKEFVRMAIRRSRGESMTAAWETPEALQTKPMAVDRHCFVQHRQRRKDESMWKAILGRQPESSVSVKSRRKTARGSSIMDISQERER